MEQVAAANPNGPGMTLTSTFYQLGIFTPLFLLISILLVIWLWILIFRIRPLSDYFAYIAATLYPFLLGIFGSIWSAIHYFHELGNNGGFGPVSPGLVLARDIGEMSVRLLGGSFLTCLFFPLGILVLLIRRPK